MRYSIFMALPVILLLASCFSSNFRTYTKGNFEAYGYIKSKNEILYHEIQIGTPQEPFNVQNKFSIKLRNGEKIASSDFSLDFVLKHYTSKYKLPENRGWGSKAIQYSFDGFSFIFSEDKLLFFNASHILLPDKEKVPEIGDTEMKNFYKLPISQQELETIFGCPDKVFDKMIL